MAGYFHHILLSDRLVLGVFFASIFLHTMMTSSEERFTSVNLATYPICWLRLLLEATNFGISDFVGFKLISSNNPRVPFVVRSFQFYSCH